MKSKLGMKWNMEKGIQHHHEEMKLKNPSDEEKIFFLGKVFKSPNVLQN